MDTAMLNMERFAAWYGLLSLFGNAAMKKISEERLVEFNADFVKIFISSVGFGFAILGYSYTDAFFRNFGISFFQLEMEWIDILFRGIILIIEWEFSVLLVFISLVVAILFGSGIFLIYSLLSLTVKVLIVSFAAFCFLIFVTWCGQALGHIHARSIWADGAGKPTFCKIEGTADALKPLIEKIDELSSKQRIRLIHRSKEQTYLAPVLDTIQPNQTRGETYVIPTKFVVYCRIVGS